VLYTQYGQQQPAPSGPQPKADAPLKQTAAEAPKKARPEDSAKEHQQKGMKATLSKIRAALDAVGVPRPAADKIEELRTCLAAVDEKAMAHDEVGAIVAAAQQRLQNIDKAEAARNTYKRALAEVHSAVDDRELLAGRLALQDMLEAEQYLKSVGEELPMEGIKARMDLTQRKAQLADMERAVQQREALEDGRKQLKEALPAKNTAAARAAIGAIARAEMELRDLHEDFPGDNGLVANGLARLHELEQEEQDRARRADALAALEVAVASRSPTQCAEALAEASDAGLDPCPAMAIANILSKPQELCTTLARSSASKLSEMRQAHGLTVDDFVEAAKVAAASMDEAELRSRAADLAASIQRNQAINSQTLERELKAAETVLREKCAHRTVAAVAEFKREREAFEEAKRNELRDLYAKMSEKRSQEIRLAVEEAYKAAKDAAHQEAMQLLGDRLVLEREGVNQRLSGLEHPVAELSELIRSGQSLQQRSQANLQVASALAALQGAVTDGRAPAKELAALRDAAQGQGDNFVRRLIDRLPAEVVAWSDSTVPTEAQLRQDFADRIRSWEAAALKPPQGGLMDHIVAGVVGPFLERLYSFGVPTRWLVAKGPDAEVVQKNVDTLSRAAPLVEKGQVQAALKVMEALTGQCRALAEDWMTEARKTLILHQAVRALQAQARCMNAALS